MISKECRDGRPQDCRGGSWCDSGHAGKALTSAQRQELMVGPPEMCGCCARPLPLRKASVGRVTPATVFTAVKTGAARAAG